MRGLVPGLPTPHPLGTRLPAIYQDQDRFTMSLMEAFDEVLAPIFSSLDNLRAYLDPMLAPDDFLDWLAGWVAIEVDETWEDNRRRTIVARAADLYRRRGTAAGLRDNIEIFTGGTVEIIENGTTAWSLDAGGPFEGDPETSLLVRVSVSNPRSLDVVMLDRLVSAAKPAQVPHRIEVVKG